MRKPTKRSLKRQLDKELSRIVRSRGRCEKCGSANELQCCHIFSRTYMSTRFFLTNLLCLCAKCHFWAHKQPILFVDFVKRRLGLREYNNLKQQAQVIIKWAIPDLETLLLKLKELNTLGV